MNKYILSMLCIFSSISGMRTQQIAKREPREWDAHAYAEGNKIQEEAALRYLQKSGIDFTGKKVLDIGCGTGNITAKIAAQAKTVDGIDASKNMIEYAQEHYATVPNLAFAQCFAEDFSSDTQSYDLALSIFCLHWIKDKQTVLKNIYNSLNSQGELFCTIATTSDPTVGMTAFKELLQRPDCSFLNASTITQEESLDKHVISDEECKDLLQKMGFAIISYEKESLTHILKNREELAQFQRPVAMGRPLFKALSEQNREWLFNEYIDLFLSKLDKNEDGYYIFEGTKTTVIHARKIADI